MCIRDRLVPIRRPWLLTVILSDEVRLNDATLFDYAEPQIVASRGQILRLKYTTYYFGCGSAPDPAGEITALAQYHWLEGGRLTSRGMGGREGKRSGED